MAEQGVPEHIARQLRQLAKDVNTLGHRDMARMGRVEPESAQPQNVSGFTRLRIQPDVAGTPQFREENMPEQFTPAKNFTTLRTE